jgi:deoxyribonuclease V
MNIPLRHTWKVSPREATQIQEELRKNLVFEGSGTSWKRIGAGDVAYSPADDRIYAAFLVFSFPDLALLENVSAQGRVSFPYIPSLFAFREAPILVKAFSRLKTKPDLVLVDGQGIAHPRSMGIASHLGLVLDLPTIGCAKSRLYGAGTEPAPEQGSAAPLMGEGRIVGMIVRTRRGVKPVYVSPGHKMDLENSVRIVLSLGRGYRIPEPLRQAHILVNQLRERSQNSLHRRIPKIRGDEL